MSGGKAFGDKSGTHNGSTLAAGVEGVVPDFPAAPPAGADARSRRRRAPAEDQAQRRTPHLGLGPLGSLGVLTSL
ncbi:hypothetical protein GCM10010324_06630 [Streptomyces hiroshimensis]|uniref:Uncharacterized protein n=1 Tax=Streptomyces hiroshimensis TaxID=66424 RepID=A0ABQ2Y5M6_9ACTN|nr:hypothetical protein GCM10010324_06630 [Streptomyces hiroshimensis]